MEKGATNPGLPPGVVSQRAITVPGLVKSPHTGFDMETPICVCLEAVDSGLSRDGYRGHIHQLVRKG